MRQLRRIGWLAVLLVLTACAAPPAATEPPAPAEQAAVPAPTEVIAEQAPEAAPTAETAAVAPEEESPANEAVEPPAETAADVQVTHPDRPAAPAAENDGFRSDPPTVFAATGSPQLLEFFTFW